MNRRKLLVLLATFTAAQTGASIAQTTTNAPKQPNKDYLAAANAKQILLLMDADKDGRISKKEWMDYMSKEFDRLDSDHNGYIDQKDLMASEVYLHHPPLEVQGK